ncbi:MAG: monovalent cation:proton antiporter-2 (CPA2) family protein, partial [Pseudomonadota bacterium]
MEPIGFHGILILLGVAVVLVALFRYLRLPQILAYLCAGIVVGPYGMGWIPDLEGTRTLAEFGLVFLMFTVGLEFSLPKLMAMKSVVFGLGGAQVLISCLVFGFVAWLFDVPAEGAVVIGGMLAMSSTAIVMKLLTEQLEQNSRHGRHAISVLLFQDLVVVPFLIVIPALAGDVRQSVWVALGWAFLKSVLVLVGIFLVGRWMLRPFFHEVASARLREYFMLAVLLLTLASAWVTEAAGLSMALGAFLAGMMLGETEYRHQVEGDILPFRDILLGLFFVTIGMMLDLGAMQELWPWVLVSVVAIVVFKTLLILGLGKLFAMETGVALRTGLVLSQVGEFAFALILQAN